MKVKAVAINSFAKWLVGGVPFEAAKDIVEALDDKDLTGEEKRARAIDRLKTFGYSLGGLLLNVAVELAVVWLREQTTQE